jgi:DNA primase
MRIPDETIEEVRATVDIVDLISEYLPLKKRGKNYTGLCPFHHEKTPSFSVSHDKQMYYCFGCSAGGNVFTFVMEHDKVSFVEAVRTLARRAGIQIPEEQPSELSTEQEELFDACRRAAEFFQETLFKTTEGSLALEYFRHRGFSDETIRRFSLGYALNGWDGFLRHGEQAGLGVQVMVKAGLVLQKEDGKGFYDRFRGRAMFPILSPSGRTIAFGARKMREDDPLGKYINSPETPIYSKSRVLYGLFHAKEAIRQKGFAVLVEGYADLITAFQAGTHNIVASSGTALTEEQIQLIGRFAGDMTLVYDADSAGSKATIRGVDLVIEQGLDVRVAALPAGEDPDSFVNRHGGKAFEDLLANAVSFLDFKVELFRQAGSMNTPEGKTRAVRSIVETLAKMKDELKRNFFIQDLAEKYGIYESLLHREIEHQLNRERRPPRGPDSGAPAPTAGVAPVLDPQAQLPAPERDLLKLMLERGPAMVATVFSRLELVDLQHPLARRLTEILLQRSQKGERWEGGSVTDTLEDPALKHLVANLLIDRYELSEGWGKLGTTIGRPDPEDVARRAVRQILLRGVDARIREEHQKMKEAEHRGEETQSYHQRIMDLQARRKEIVAGREDPPQ